MLKFNIKKESGSFGDTFYYVEIETTTAIIKEGYMNEIDFVKYLKNIQEQLLKTMESL